MTITVQAEDVRDARRKLGANERTADIRIKWRDNDFGLIPLSGCIVDATYIGRRVPVEFDTASKALSYIGKILRDRDKLAKAKGVERMKEAKAAKKK